MCDDIKKIKINRQTMEICSVTIAFRGFSVSPCSSQMAHEASENLEFLGIKQQGVFYNCYSFFT